MFLLLHTNTVVFIDINFQIKKRCRQENICNVNHCETQELTSRPISVRTCPDSGYQGEKTTRWPGKQLSRDVVTRSTREDFIIDTETQRGPESKEVKEASERQELKYTQIHFGVDRDESFSDSTSEVIPVNTCPSCRL